MGYEWLKIVGADSDLPFGNGPMATLDMNARTLEFTEDVELKAHAGKALTFGDGIKRGLVAAERTFVEQGAGVYTGSVVLPAGAWLVDIYVQADVLWAAADSASMIVGDSDPNGYYDAIDLKATDLTAAQTISFGNNGGVGGVYLSGSASHVNGRYSATERTITGEITSVGAGTAGRTRMVVVYVLPDSEEAEFVEAS